MTTLTPTAADSALGLAVDEGVVVRRPNIDDLNARMLAARTGFNVRTEVDGSIEISATHHRATEVLRAWLDVVVAGRKNGSSAPPAEAAEEMMPISVEPSGLEVPTGVRAMVSGGDRQEVSGRKARAKTNPKLKRKRER